MYTGLSLTLLTKTMQHIVLWILVMVFAIPLYSAEEYCGKPVCYVVNELDSRNRHIFKIDCNDAERYLPAKIIRYRCARDISIGDLHHGIGPFYEMTSEPERSDVNPISSAPPISPLPDGHSKAPTKVDQTNNRGITLTELPTNEDTAGTSTNFKGETTTVTASMPEKNTADDYTTPGVRQSSSNSAVTTDDVADVASSAADTVKPTTVQSCESADWTFWNTSCYKLFTDRYSREQWYDAKQECESNSAHLVVIECDEEYNFITETLPIDSSIGTWIGLKRDGFTAPWEWHDSTETIPADGTIQLDCSSTSYKCIAITKADINRWQCSTCNDAKPFICEEEK